MGNRRVKDKKLRTIQPGYRYVGLDLTQFHWECMKLEAASEELTETDILRRIIRSWSEALPPATQKKARAATARVEAWKARKIRAPQSGKFQGGGDASLQTATVKTVPIGHDKAS